METQTRRDLIISGMMGGQGGGFYKSVTIHGLGRINGDLDCLDFTCHGRVNIQGSVKTQKAEIHGLSSIEEDMQARAMKVYGKATVGGQLSGEELEIYGFMTVNGSCDAESFQANGGFKIQGMLNAGHIEIQLNAKCEAREIGGGSIRVEKPANSSKFGKLMQSLLPKFDVLTTDTIEGDDIYLENTRAKVVRGSNITIGPGCEIELVEYKDHFHRDENAKVIESRPV
ncbi:polymer-forming cytoskeletal protein [Paenibacillus cremeus]|uniref:Bactofilin n=1 Tax=Paenibacillus cremeus TaxID=2163881 RepID=A0A559KA56_9BACL|nr:polymer-forming cytoskeletal protein [Paenibacillus cremeus]TVY08989.1 hypothetical protein FPZ49_16025 [Paenibacillus cremeus]